MIVNLWRDNQDCTVFAFTYRARSVYLIISRVCEIYGPFQYVAAIPKIVIIWGAIIQQVIIYLVSIRSGLSMSQMLVFWEVQFPNGAWLYTTAGAVANFTALNPNPLPPVVNQILRWITILHCIHSIKTDFTAHVIY